MKRFLAIFLCLVMLTSSFSLVLAEGTEPGGSENETQPEPWEGESYTITFVVDGVEVPVTTHEGEVPVYPNGTPTKAEDDDYTYEFAGWDPELVAATESATYTAQFNATPKAKSYTITFVDEDGTELQSSEVAEGDTPEYTGETPTKAATAQYTYTFAGWTPEVAAVTGEATYTATYDATVNKYTVQFVNHDGSVLQTEELEYGATPEYTGETPTKAEDETYTYAFDTWTPEIVAVTGEATYTATYTATEKETTTALRGDANGDGTFDNRDITLALQAAAGFTVEFDQDACDVDGISGFDNRDITLLLQAGAGYDVELK